MFEGIGKNAVDGAMKRIAEIYAGFTNADYKNFLTGLKIKIPFISDLIAGYDSMTPEEKALFTKNIMLAVTAIAAQMASKNGKVAF